MLRKLPAFLTGLFDRSSSGTPGSRVQREVIPRDQHDISRKNVSRAALNTLYGLHKAGFEAYLVGGCLRDMLTGGHPKDFDVVTDATPEQVKDVFRRARLIGRRFKIVHVRFGPEVIEVATFRALHDGSDDDGDAMQSDSGMLLRDNVYGTIEEDALRRDFTINALYYNIADFGLYDFLGSMADIQARRIRLIGEPERRYREDPVRMLRAARFAAKLGFEIEPATREPIDRLAPLIQDVPPARLFDEMLKLFMTGYGEASLEQVQALGLLEVLFPETARVVSADDSGWIQTLMVAAMQNTDRRLSQDKPVTPAFLFAIMLWPVILDRMQGLRANGMPANQALHKTAGRVLGEQNGIIAIPKRFSTVMREIWDLQMRLDKRKGKGAERMINHPRFRAAYDFLLLREKAGEIAPGLGDWWTQYQDADTEEREAMTRALGGGKGKRSRRRRRGGKKPSSQQ
jgi:poly(A) polymerase